MKKRLDAFEMKGLRKILQVWGRPRTAWMDYINMWTGLPVKESFRMTEDRDKWRKYVHCGQPSDRGCLKNRTEPSANHHSFDAVYWRGEGTISCKYCCAQRCVSCHCCCMLRWRLCNTILGKVLVGSFKRIQLGRHAQYPARNVVRSNVRKSLYDHVYVKFCVCLSVYFFVFMNGFRIWKFVTVYRIVIDFSFQTLSTGLTKSP